MKPRHQIEINGFNFLAQFRFLRLFQFVPKAEEMSLAETGQQVGQGRIHNKKILAHLEENQAAENQRQDGHQMKAPDDFGIQGLPGLEAPFPFELEMMMQRRPQEKPAALTVGGKA